MRQFKISERYTIRHSDSLNRYLSEVSQYPLLNLEEEFKVSTAARSGDQAALEKLVRSNLRFVISVAKMYGGRDAVLLGDLINEGNMGLVEAAHLFDPTTGFKFISYAVWHVRKNMTKYLTDNSRTVRIPQNKVSALNRIKDIESRMATKLDRDPTRDEVVEEYVKTSPEMMKLKSTDGAFDSIKEVMEMGSKPVPLEGDSSNPDQDFGPIEYLNGDSDGADHLVLKNDSIEVLNTLLSFLNSREREVISKRFGIGGAHPESRDSLADQFEVSIETIRGWETKIIRKLSRFSKKAGINQDMLS